MEVNAALLEADGHRSRPRLETLVQMVHWAQDLMDKKRLSYLKMTDFGEALFEEQKKKVSLASEDLSKGL